MSHVTTPVALPLASALARAAAVAALALALPAAAFAQAAGGRGGPGGGMAMVMAGTFREAVDQIDLPADVKSKADDALQKAQADVREQMQGMRDLSPEDRQAKAKDVQKTLTDARDGVVADLTPDQRSKLAQKVAQLSVGHATDAVAAEKKAAAGMDVPDDQKKQLDGLFDDTAKQLDGYRADADAARDAAAEMAVQQRVVTALQSANKQLTDILGQDDARQVQRAGMQAMRPAGANGGGGGRRRKATTAPAADPAK